MSFRRNVPGSDDSSTLNVPGIRRWLAGVYLASSGISGLDEALGGGIPARSMIFVKHDEPTSNYLTLFRCFLAEGIAKGHAVIKCSPTNAIANDTLPLVLGKGSRSLSKSTVSEKLKISWRYKNEQRLLHPNEASIAPISPSRFNLSKPIDNEMLCKNMPYDISLRTFSRYSAATDDYYDDLLALIKNQLDSKRCCGDSPFNFCRVALESIISPFLRHDPASSLRPLVRFLHLLKRLSRTSFSVFMISIPAHIMNADSFGRFEHLFDIVLNFKSFAGRGSVYGNYDGIIQVERLPSIHLKTHRPVCNEWLFKVKKSDVIIERPSLPVDDSAKEEPSPSPMPCSGGVLPKSFDF